MGHNALAVDRHRAASDDRAAGNLSDGFIHLSNVGIAAADPDLSGVPTCLGHIQRPDGFRRRDRQSGSGARMHVGFPFDRGEGLILNRLQEE